MNGVITDISKAEQPQTFSENQHIARRGGKVAGIARQALEAETGKSVITSLNAADFRQPITSIVEDAASLPVITEQASNEDKKAD